MIDLNPDLSPRHSRAPSRIAAEIGDGFPALHRFADSGGWQRNVADADSLPGTVSPQYRCPRSQLTQIVKIATHSGLTQARRRRDALGDCGGPAHEAKYSTSTRETEAILEVFHLRSGTTMLGLGAMMLFLRRQFRNYVFRRSPTHRYGGSGSFTRWSSSPLRTTVHRFQQGSSYGQNLVAAAAGGGGTFSCKTVPRGLPSSTTQLRKRGVCRRLFCSWHT